MDIITENAPRCLNCGSAARTKYHDVSKIAIDRNGFTHLTTRHTRCGKCGQPRIERRYEHTIIPTRPRKTET